MAVVVDLRHREKVEARPDRGRVPHVVIVGGGFAGLHAARALARAPVRITLVDRRNHHLFQPLLYQVATAALSPANIAQPIRLILHRQRNVSVRLSEVLDVDRQARRIVMDDGELDYDYLILAAGATHAYFGHPEWQAVAPGLKMLEDATQIRRDFLLAFENAEKEADPQAQRVLLTFVVVGAGPTGVELAGTMSEVIRRILLPDYPHIKPSLPRVILLQAGDRVLPNLPETLSASAKKQLEHLGVEVRLNSRVTDVEPGYVCMGDDRIRTDNVYWAAGVAASSLGARVGKVDSSGRVEVGPDLTVPDDPRVFVVGDLARVSQKDGRLVPGQAPGAMQMGASAAANIIADLRNRPRRPFVYFDKGQLATIGHHKAVADIRGWQVSGTLAWFLWLFVHLYFLVGLENRLLVVLQWAISYTTSSLGARLITYPAPATCEVPNPTEGS